MVYDIFYYRGGMDDSPIEEIYLMYEIDGTLYENSIKSYTGEAKEGKNITIYCNKNDYTEITTKHMIKNDTLLLIFLCIIKVGFIIFSIATIIEEKEKKTKKE